MDYNGRTVAIPDSKPSAPASRVLLVLGQMPLPVELIDQDCRVLYCNVAYATTFLDRPSDILDRPSRVFPERLADGRSRTELLGQVQRDGIWKGEVQVLTARKQELPVRLCVFPIHEPTGPVEFAVLYEDIRGEVAARESLVHQQNLVAIRSRQAQMGELLSMIAHQWRQPLTVVMSLIGNIQLKAQMGASIDPAYLKGKLERMSQTVQFLSETIDAFRNFHAPSRHKTVENLGALARKALDLVLPTLTKLGITVEFEAPDALQARVFGSEFQQLVLELVNNAREALVGCEVGNPVLRIRLSTNEGWAILVVWNNGLSIAPEVLPRVFEPYYTTKDSTAGSGLGLYMAKTIVETHHGGRLTVESGPGSTSFSATFPLEVSRES